MRHENVMRHWPYLNDDGYERKKEGKISSSIRRTKSRLVMEAVILMQPIAAFSLPVAPLAAAFFIAAGCFAIFIIVS